MDATKCRDNLQLLSVLGLCLGMSAALGWYYDSYAVNWQPVAFTLALVAVTAGIILLTLLVLRIQGEKCAAALAWKTARPMRMRIG